MVTTLPLLQNVKVASPCFQPWSEMKSIDGDRVRFCESCQFRVYNLSAMTQPEAEGLLRKHEGRLCVRYFQRQDGTVMTRDCPIGMHAVRLLMWRRSVTAAALSVLLIGAGVSTRWYGVESGLQADKGHLPVSESTGLCASTPGFPNTSPMNGQPRDNPYVMVTPSSLVVLVDQDADKNEPKR